MNIEFHYYITKLVAVEAGLMPDEAEIVAYASQFVDDNNQVYTVEQPDGDTYTNLTTQYKDITAPPAEKLRINLLHHYLPGNPTNSKVRRDDGKMHSLMTTPVSQHAQEIFFDTTKGENLYKLGIAAHMLADSVSHQNFIGIRDEMNNIQPAGTPLKPFIGHEDAGYKPDIPVLMWYDPRLPAKNAQINNIERTLMAAQKLYTNFLMLTAEQSSWGKLKQKLLTVLSEPITEDALQLAVDNTEKRILSYRALLAEVDADSVYEKDKWTNDCILTDGETYHFADNYTQKAWYRFQESVKQYQAIAANKLGSILQQVNIQGW